MSRWLLELPDELDVVVDTTIEGDPATKGRPRLGRNGNVYTPKSTKEAQELIGWAVLAAKGQGGCDSDSRFGVIADFYAETWQRSDVDNMLKVVLDGCTGVIWDDDSQVTEVAGRVTRGSDHPRTELTIYRTSRQRTPDDGECDRCGATFRLYPSQSDRRFCSRECRDDAQRQKVTVPCAGCGSELLRKPSQIKRRPDGQHWCSTACRSKHTTVEFDCAACGTTVRRARSLVRRRTRSYCDESCRADYWREHRAKAARGTCQDCGGPTSKKKYRRCQACAIEAQRTSA